MSYFFDACPQQATPPGTRLKALINRSEILRLPGAHNGMAALQAKAAGFEALYLSGAAISASMGLPDLGVISIEDVSFFARQIVRATGLPLVVDGDTGHGEVLNVMQTVRSIEEAGAAAVHLEDQKVPKKCGHLDGKRLISPEDMARKVAAAVAVRRHMLIIARTDAVGSEGLDGAVCRAERYIAAGADAIFPEALSDLEMCRQFRRRLPGIPLLANMTEFGKTDDLDADALSSIGYEMIIWPVSSLRVANKAQEEFYRALAQYGSTKPMLHRMQTRSELYAVIELDAFERLSSV